VVVPVEPHELKERYLRHLATKIVLTIYCCYGSLPLEPHELKEKYLRHLATKFVLTIYCWCGGAC
jgi:hypothetical protein